MDKISNTIKTTNNIDRVILPTDCNFTNNEKELSNDLPNPNEICNIGNYTIHTDNEVSSSDEDFLKNGYVNDSSLLNDKNLDLNAPSSSNSFLNLFLRLSPKKKVQSKNLQIENQDKDSALKTTMQSGKENTEFQEQNNHVTLARSGNFSSQTSTPKKGILKTNNKNHISTTKSFNGDINNSDISTASEKCPRDDTSEASLSSTGLCRFSRFRDKFLKRKIRSSEEKIIDIDRNNTSNDLDSALSFKDQALDIVSCSSKLESENDSIASQSHVQDGVEGYDIHSIEPSINDQFKLPAISNGKNIVERLNEQIREYDQEVERKFDETEKLDTDRENNNVLPLIEDDNSEYFSIVRDENIKKNIKNWKNENNTSPSVPSEASSDLSSKVFSANIISEQDSEKDEETNNINPHHNSDMVTAATSADNYLSVYKTVEHYKQDYLAKEASADNLFDEVVIRAGSQTYKNLSKLKLLFSDEKSEETEENTQLPCLRQYTNELLEKAENCVIKNNENNANKLSEIETKYKAKISQLKKKMVKELSFMDKLDKENDNLAIDNGNLKKELNSSKELLILLQKKTENLDAEKNELEIKLRQKEEQHEECKNDFKTLQEKYNGLKSKKEGVEKEYTQTFKNLQKLTIEYDVLLKNNTCATDKVYDVLKQITGSSNDLNDLLNKFEKLELDRGKISKELDNIKDYVKDLETKNGKLKKSYKGVERKVFDLKRENQQFKQQLNLLNCYKEQSFLLLQQIVVDYNQVLDKESLSYVDNQIKEFSKQNMLKQTFSHNWLNQEIKKVQQFYEQTVHEILIKEIVSNHISNLRANVFLSEQLKGLRRQLKDKDDKIEHILKYTGQLEVANKVLKKKMLTG
ncbi:uncharacterized protein SCODWIG_03392 [Saccharomycodes ludwigii]|uniref:Uncharacterized protein n=1 Tax=Saccharomycodes ludwigii TaxID=36035 RepID=A0A376BAJ7_9ASCO|nr:uncharacterized protein SCODWIG_03392 [Saccharomycodes ludwigii]